jgi:signal peptidase I
MTASELGISPRKKRASWVRELLETAILTIVIFLVVRVALQNFRVQGSSMEPNLHSGEYILVNKVDYLLHPPQRGDIIVFKAVPAGESDKDFIKRVIGLPGDTVAVRNDRVFINHHLLVEPYRHNPENYSFGPATVPRHDYFVLGDNRSNSYDSSKWATPWLAQKYIVGKAWIAYWPPADLSLFQTPSFAAKHTVRK